jgi:hypothetical protein
MINQSKEPEQIVQILSTFFDNYEKLVAFDKDNKSIDSEMPVGLLRKELGLLLEEKISKNLIRSVFEDQELPTLVNCIKALDELLKENSDLCSTSQDVLAPLKEKKKKRGKSK